MASLRVGACLSSVLESNSRRRGEYRIRSSSSMRAMRLSSAARRLSLSTLASSYVGLPRAAVCAPLHVRRLTQVACRLAQQQETNQPQPPQQPQQQPSVQQPVEPAAPSSQTHAPDIKPNIKTFVDGMLTRDFISASLYASGEGYFNNHPRVFGSEGPASIPFRECKGKEEYQRHLQNLYALNESCWVTPVELFKPYYAQAIARWILETRKKELGVTSVPRKERPEEDGVESALEKSARERDEATAAAAPVGGPLAPVNIVEIGGGNGTCALNILDYLRTHYPSLYARTQYTIVELSEVCAGKQREVLRPHSAHTRLLHMSILEWRERQPPDAASSTFIIALEVLDNMPHDRIRVFPREDHEDSSSTPVIQQSHVYANEKDVVVAPWGHSKSSWTAPTGADVALKRLGSERFHERHTPVLDRWVKEYASYLPALRRKKPPSMISCFRENRFATKGDAWTVAQMQWLLLLPKLSSAFSGKGNASTWLPTTQLQLLHILRHYFPRHHVLLADFSRLPSTVEGANGPIVSSKDSRTGGQSVDHKTYLLSAGVADIFFPTDFQAIHHVYQRVCMDRKGGEVRDEGDGVEPDMPEEVALALRGSGSDGAAAPPATLPEPSVLTTHQFMTRYASPYTAALTTKDGWCPLHRDYLNFSFFLGSSDPRKGTRAQSTTAQTNAKSATTDAAAQQG